MKVFHTADWHFREKDHDEISKCVGFILQQAIELKPDLICISGDITDSKYLSFDSRSARAILHIISDMLDIAPVAIVIGTPSHDGKAALALRECRGKYSILVSDMPGRFIYDGYQKKWLETSGLIFPNDVPFFMITQIPQPTKQYFINEMSIEDTDKAISSAMDSIFAGFGNIPAELGKVPHIVNGHGQIGGAFISETQQLIGHDIEISKSQLSMLNADLVCYGHIHKAQDMGNNIFYSGSPARMNFGETEDKGFYIHEIHSHKTVEPKFIKTPATYLHNAKFDLTKDIISDGLSLDIMMAIESMCEGISSDYDEWGAKITITAWQDEAAKINQTEIEKMLSDWGAQIAKVSLIRKPRETVRAEKVMEADALTEKLEAMAELRGEDITAGILDKAAMVESGEKEPWKLLDKQE